VLSRNLEKSLHRALACANERRHEYVTLEHLPLSLTEDQDAVASPLARSAGLPRSDLHRRGAPIQARGPLRACANSTLPRPAKTSLRRRGGACRGYRGIATRCRGEANRLTRQDTGFERTTPSGIPSLGLTIGEP